MALTRIKFSDSDDSNQYICTINPVEIDPQDSTDMELVSVLDGTPVRLTSAFDDRIRTLTWDYFPTDNTTWSALVSEIKQYKGQNKKLHLEDIGDPLGLTSWQNIFVLDVQTTLRRGGRLMQNMVLTYSLRE